MATVTGWGKSTPTDTRHFGASSIHESKVVNKQETVTYLDLWNFRVIHLAIFGFLGCCNKITFGEDGFERNSCVLIGFSCQIPMHFLRDSCSSIGFWQGWSDSVLMTWYESKPVKTAVNNLNNSLFGVDSMALPGPCCLWIHLEYIGIYWNLLIGELTIGKYHRSTVPSVFGCALPILIRSIPVLF